MDDAHGCMRRNFLNDALNAHSIGVKRQRAMNEAQSEYVASVQFG
jgi:hypothetical protein